MENCLGVVPSNFLDRIVRCRDMVFAIAVVVVVTFVVIGVVTFVVIVVVTFVVIVAVIFLVVVLTHNLLGLFFV